MFQPVVSILGDALLVVLLYVGLIWLMSLVKKDASIIDSFWGLGFVLLAWLYFLDAGPVELWRARLVPALVTIWGLRLSGYIFLRNLGKGEDYRYREMRERHGSKFPLVSLFTVFVLQGTLMWIISVPLLMVQLKPAAPARWLDVVALVCWAVGLCFEALGDWQLSQFKANPSNRGKVLDTGLWRFTRHPNYFGDALVWWGYFCFAAAVGDWWTIYAPVLMTVLLMKVSGVALLEATLRATKPQYQDYVARTSAFFPWRPKR